MKYKHRLTDREKKSIKKYINVISLQRKNSSDGPSAGRPCKQKIVFERDGNLESDSLGEIENEVAKVDMDCMQMLVKV